MSREQISFQSQFSNNRLGEDFFSRPTLRLAKDLLGKILVRRIDEKILKGKIVETEAYVDRNDLAAHSAAGKTARNKVMFGEPGLAYVYFTYGMHYCFNIVAEKIGRGCAVLIRSLEPIEGLEFMMKFRGTDSIENLTNGPAKLCEAFNIDKRLNGCDLKTSNELFLIDSEISQFKIVQTTRVGIKQSIDKKYRFYIKGNPFVSKK
ncbi:MAG: DNA-3-methyladenine glycosylase [Ignavibacteria bacterium]|nr:DNA-3-methyladenine glycosylase [Ignavibacteria bacterium]